MIFQLKITLKDSKPPIWRRIEIRDTMNFHELHRVIQVAFDWGDFHLHGFDIRKSNSNSNYLFGYNSIGPIWTEEFGDVDFTYDENEVLLKDVFKVVKDWVQYTYDYGDDWDHSVVLEKILPDSDVSFFPRCKKVVREAPLESNRFAYLETGIVTEEVDGNEAAEDINLLLEEEFALT
ncbi:plasmid pRiA4b ORF-3 family protein [Fredinandcohnia sp. 179-A 10B2 NHS]|uniref:plasmid pRiA4b ORF-3 family protein n=1 Tax=Fredinandcohnia sp. 179-A 10B2 NHS TaxID=3235176 RepID=UPI0039A0786D